MEKSVWAQLKPILEKALTLDPENKEAYLKEACSGDPKLHAEAIRMLANESELTFEWPPAFWFAGKASTCQEGQLLGRYKLIKEIGRGGMGTVFLAERVDGEYDQKVAIKILQDGRTSAALVQKLRNERQILASLKHPNIVNILDGGSTDQGIPFIVMEYVDGKSITDYIEEQQLGLNQKLHLFQKLCDVISFAHQKLIIHRDIKPSNILITRSGEIKLLDFGIAKILNTQDQTFQETQQLFITPEYASPEHIKGQPLGMSSEVYSLGILFYQILTGINPFTTTSGSLSSWLEVICEYNPPPPSKQIQKINPKLDSDLDHICLKALRKDPKERYHSVDHFSQDIARYLSHLPVIATRGQWPYRAKKFALRNRTFILSGLAILLTILAGLFSSLYQAGMAKAMFNDLRSLTGSMLFEFYDGVASLEGTTAVKELVISRAITYLEKLESRNSGNPELMNEVSDGYQRLGNIQGNSYVANMGKTGDAYISYSKAVRISESLVIKNSTNQKYAFSLSQAYLGLGDIMYTLGRLDTTLVLYQKSNHLLSELSDKHPDSLKYRLALSESFNRIGDVSGMYGYSNLGNTSMAISSYHKSIEILEKGLAREPGNAAFRNALAVSLSMLASLYTVTGKHLEAIDAGYQSVFSFEALLEKDPNNYVKLANILQTKNAMREPLTETMRMDEALRLLKEVELRLLESLRLDPQNKHTQENLAINYNAIGRILTEMGEFEKASGEHQKAHAILKDYGNNLGMGRNLGLTLEFMGNAHFENKEYQIAVNKYEEAMALYKVTDSGLIHVVQIKINLCRLYMKDRPGSLLQDHLNALLALEKQSREDTLNIRYVVFLSEYYDKTARALSLNRNRRSKTETIHDPCYYYRRSLELSGRLMSKNVLSPLQLKKRNELIKSFAACAY